ncbi:phosphatidylserine decarboxylase [Luteitalea sp.]|jgi:phosphatidylserine decarboxylase|uniref:phosphatidylserine decarboxylase n=1 Tax=Luteitalea sp. TaxID=2004800 RepID=UPI000AE9EA2C|nr:phosphatidylserine decarboxylase [Luteitalea sp.]
MKLDRAGYPFIAGALAPAAYFLLKKKPGVGMPLLGLAGFLAYFFRDPDRYPPQHPDLVLSPADGRVMVAGPGEPGVAPPGDWQQISIFLSPLDVHINRTPYGGEITRIAYTPGKFLAAYDDRAAAENERNELWIKDGARTVVFRQVVGVLARRVVCRVQVGDQLVAGERFGLMKFGSRMDVFVPPECVLQVKPGDVVRAAETVLARWPDA